MSEFVHLRACSEYSLLYSAARAADLAQAAKEYGMFALGVADRGGMYGAVSVYRCLQQVGVAPLLGTVVDVVRERQSLRMAQRTAPAEVVLYPLGAPGWQALCELWTLAATADPAGERVITWDELFARAAHLLCLTGGARGPLAVVGRAEGTGGRDEEGLVNRRLQHLQEAFGDRLYIELVDQGTAEDRVRNRALSILAGKAKLPCVATAEIRYLARDGQRIVDILHAVNTGSSLVEAIGQRHPDARFGFLDPAAMRARFAEYPDALARTLEVAERAALELPLGRFHLPKFPVDQGWSEAELLSAQAFAGLFSRLPEADARYRERLSYELNVIVDMGFAGYFLIVWDFMRYAHEQGITTGPGRGSAAGSLVAFALAITDLDPVEYNLLFERFLNPERVSWPDIDIDFAAERRQEVIAYVVRRYGADRVAQIGTLGTFAARAAVKDVARVLQAAPPALLQLTRLLPSGPGASLEEALRQPDVQTLLKTTPSLQPVLDAALAIEGLPRHASIHAAGVVISIDPLTRWTPLMPGSEETVLATQYSMGDIEALGLLKMDFLGLRTLSLCDRTEAHIAAVRGERPVYDERHFDAKTLALLADGDTDGCFQLESTGVKHVLRALRPEHMEDLIAVISLYRPGPMEQIGAYIDARRGRTTPRYEPAELEPVLGSTYGILVYQEQIMQIAAVMAGFSLGQADVLRRAVAKKKREDLDRNREAFVAGCRRQGHADETAQAVYDLIVRFADYGFNRSHAAAYAMLAYRTVFLKANFRAEFMAALIADNAANPDKMARYALSCARSGIAVLVPDVQMSVGDCAPERLGEGMIGLRLGLFTIRNVGVQAVQHLVEERLKSGPYRSLGELLTRLDSRSLTKRVVESLIQSGACDSFGLSRRRLLAELERLAPPDRRTTGRRSGARQLPLTGLEEPHDAGVDVAVPPAMAGSVVDPQEWADDPKQIEDWEKELLGFVVSRRPYLHLQRTREKRGQLPLADLLATDDGVAMAVSAHDSAAQPQDPKSRSSAASLSIIGQVAAWRAVQTKRGESMGFLSLEDETARAEIVIFPGVYRLFGESPAVGQIWEGSVRRDPAKSDSLIAVTMRPVLVTPETTDAVAESKPSVQASTRRLLYLRIPAALETDRERLVRLRTLLIAHPGSDGVVLVYESGRALSLDSVHVRIGDVLEDALGQAFPDVVVGIREATRVD